MRRDGPGLSPSQTSPGAREGQHLFRSLENPRFRMLWFGTLFSAAAMQINMVAQSWLAYHLTGSAALLGVVAGARSIPMLLLSMVGGFVADRVRKRNVIAISQLTLGISSFTVAVLVHTGLIQFWHLVVVGAVQGTCFAFNMPSRQAYIPELVGKERLSNAIAIHTMAMNFNRIVGPAVAGILLTLGPRLPFYTTSLIYAGAVLTILNLPPGKRVDTSERKRVWDDFVGGLGYMWNQQLIRTLLLMAFVPTFLGMPYMQLLPVFQADVFRVGPSQLGAMYTAVGMGSLTSSLVVAGVSGHPRIRFLQLLSGVGFGLFLLAFALSPSLPVALAALFGTGFFSQGYMVINQILLMNLADTSMYGRVSSVRLITWSLNPLALLTLGALVDAWGAPPVVAVQGALLALFIVGLAARYPSLRADVRLPGPGPETGPPA